MAYFWRRIGDEFLLGSTNVNRIFCKEVFGTPWNTGDAQFGLGYTEACRKEMIPSQTIPTDRNSKHAGALLFCVPLFGLRTWGLEDLRQDVALHLSRLGYPV